MKRRSAQIRAAIALSGVILLCTVGAASAIAGVRAFDATTGEEDPSFARFGSAKEPQAVISDGRHGVYVLGHPTLAGARRSILHVLADGTIDPAFQLSLHPGTIRGGAVRGNELALVGA